MPWDVSNFSVTYAYNEITRRNVNIEHSMIKTYRGALSLCLCYKRKSLDAI
jgi:hypothetical protein